MRTADGEGMKPYYEDSAVQIFHGDCRDILPSLPKVDLVLTDPPYPDQHPEYGDCDILFLAKLDCRQVVFWSAKVDFPLDYTAIHIWDKVIDCASYYERIFERNGLRIYKVYRCHPVNSWQSAQGLRDVWTGHKSQKPRRLIEQLVTGYSIMDTLILDPFMGSGTTLRAAKDLGRKAIGIEIEEKYCEIAAKRMSQMVLSL